PLEFDLAVATRQSADNPVFYVQYAHARVASLFRTAAQQGIATPDWATVDFSSLERPEENALIKRVIQFSEVAPGAGPGGSRDSGWPPRWGRSSGTAWGSSASRHPRACRRST